jgi:cell fate regulator YaaT (PSP1 superfamily)
MGSQVLVRYGNVSQAARYNVPAQIHHSVTRGLGVVVRTDRGLEIGHVLEVLPPSLVDAIENITDIERFATDKDRETYDRQQQQSDIEFETWHHRMQEWNLQLELIDLERTLDDERVILYVLNDQNAETTRLALLAAAAGLGIIHVQPVSADGIVSGSGGGCGSGCGCSH